MRDGGLLFGFYEMPLRLRHKAAGIGIKLDGLIEQGHLEILWHPPTENILDALGNRLLEAVRRRRVKRLVIARAEIKSSLVEFWCSSFLYVDTNGDGGPKWRVLESSPTHARCSASIWAISGSRSEMSLPSSRKALLGWPDRDQKRTRSRTMLCVDGWCARSSESAIASAR
jgi:hypothetical protein